MIVYWMVQHAAFPLRTFLVPWQDEEPLIAAGYTCVGCVEW